MIIGGRDQSYSSERSVNQNSCVGCAHGHLTRRMVPHDRGTTTPVLKSQPVSARKVSCTKAIR